MIVFQKINWNFVRISKKLLNFNYKPDIKYFFLINNFIFISNYFYFIFILLKNL